MRRYFPDIEGFRAAARSAEIVPVYRQLLADRLTPVGAFEVLGREEHAFLLESVVGGERVARYSFIASAPSLVYQVAGGRGSITRPGSYRMAGGPQEGEFDTQDPLADLQALLYPDGRPRRHHRVKDLPAFTGGLVGYAGYDTIRYYEGEKLPAPPRDDRRLPDLLFGLYNEMVIFDHVDKTIKVVANAEVGEGSGFRVQGSEEQDPIEAAYRGACRRVDAIVTRLQQPPTSRIGEIDTGGQPTLKFESNFTRGAFESAV